MRFFLFAIALYVAGIAVVDVTLFDSRYTNAVWREAGRQALWAGTEVRQFLGHIGI